MSWRRPLLVAIVVMAAIGVMVALATALSPEKSSIAASVTIQRPKSQVFAWLTDPTKRPQWVNGVSSTRLLTQPPVAADSVWQDTVEQDGERVAITSDVVDFSPGQGLSTRITTRSYDLVTHYALDGNGSTTLKLTGEITYHGWLPRLMASRIQAAAQAKADTDLHTLKGKIEGSQAEAPPAEAAPPSQVQASPVPASQVQASPVPANR